MKSAIMQPYFLPYIGYFQLIHAVDVFIIYDDVNYIKKGWINRNNILVNGTAFLFSIPLQNMSQHKLINELNITENSNWRNDLLKTITLSYKKAPLYNEVFPIIVDIITNEEQNLAKFVTYSLRKVCKYLCIDTEILISSDIEKNDNLKGQDKIIEICKKVQIDHYVNAIGGMELYDKEVFLENKLSLNFIKPKGIIYSQFKNEFIPWLSIIDVMMFNSTEQIKNFLEQYDLI